MIIDTLNNLVALKKITSYKETLPNTQTIKSTPTENFSVVIGSVEQEIDDKLISEHIT